jgi:hypothetical protein
VTQVGGVEAASVAAGSSPRRGAIDWHAQYRLDPATSWSECRLLDITLTGALIELPDDPPHLLADHPFFLQISSIADDDVGIVMRAVVTVHEPAHHGISVIEIEFDGRREERMLLTLLVRLRTLV